MINKKVDDAIFEVILTHAFREAFAQEMEQIEAEDSQPAQPSEKYQKQEQRYYKKMQRKPVKSVTILRVVAACAAVYIGLSSGLILFSPPVRAAVVDTVVGFFEKYLVVGIADGENSIVLGEYTLEYVPREFELVNSQQTPYFSCYVFSNGTDDFKVYFYTTNEPSLKYDNEQTNLTSTKVKGVDAYYINCGNCNYALLWDEDDRTVSIEGSIAMNVMKKIAENIS